MQYEAVKTVRKFGEITFNRKAIQLQNVKFVPASSSARSKAKKHQIQWLKITCTRQLNKQFGDMKECYLVWPSSGLFLLSNAQYKHTYGCSAAKINQC